MASSTLDKEYNESLNQNNQFYYQKNQSYSKTIQSYQSYNLTMTEVLHNDNDNDRSVVEQLLR